MRLPRRVACDGTHVPQREQIPCPETKAQRSAARQGAATRKRHAAEAAEPPQASAVERTAELSEEVLKSSRGRAAGRNRGGDPGFIGHRRPDAPALGERPSRRQEIVGAAMEMADGLVHAIRLHSQGREERRDDALEDGQG